MNKKTKSLKRRKIVIGINGFGRIGRAVFRVIAKRSNIEVAAINDINPDNKNIAYQLKYDSLYGTFPDPISDSPEGIAVGKKKIAVYHTENIDEVPWEKQGVSIVVDSSGVYENVLRASGLRKKIDNVIMTHSPNEMKVDKTIIMGVNESKLNPKKDFLISSSICDANAIAPVLHLLNQRFGIQHGFLTTIHPWLTYQNLLDGPSPSFAYPGHINPHYTFGRASTFSLLPKPTSTMTAVCKVIPELEGKFSSFSYRVPTAIVSSSDVSIKLQKRANTEDIKKLFKEVVRKQRFDVIYNNEEPLVSIDFKGLPYSSIVDHRWITVNDENYLKVILWYDNEWGYASRVADVISLLQK
ncbi:MAG: glyceraldehyde 3-phosphate dehydrogenase NAD-binding domain-containing protein [bacterium]|nr:glyceraldehyde 3-phosphate dehydrogenase NAD-binding domain-containing protein [bacterium]